MPKPHIVFVASEAAPLAKTGGLADVTGSLPAALRRLDHDVTVIIPLYRRHIDPAVLKPGKAKWTIRLWIGGALRQVPLHEAHVQGQRFILVEQDDMFARDGLYGPAGGAYEDNLLRYTLFVRAALEAAALLKEPVDLFHCHDWQAALLPMLLKTQYQHHPTIARAGTVFTIHNLAYQGIFPASQIPHVGLPPELFHPGCYEFYGQINCMKAGIMMADRITTVSPSYAEEILTPEYGCHLEGFLAQHRHKLSGIVNGLDTVAWDPATDAALPARFGAGRAAGKGRCKLALQQQLGLAPEAGTPLLAMISRLAEQKGVDLLLPCVPDWVRRGYQMAFLGTGEAHYEAGLKKLADNHPQQVHFFRGFNETLARRIYAGSDLFLMPSRFEPCGLSQLMAMRYGTVPVVRATGGLIDTVTDYDAGKGKSTGFAFTAANAASLAGAVDRAVEVYHRPAAWNPLRNRAMRRDSSWEASARSYAELYRQLP
ncbi:MAG TPA: glycogen synthase GlgA [Mariprofundaceae bacterium]|nr:glycogen synthase GlgA [Mariprofundaceae bacterium]